MFNHRLDQKPNASVIAHWFLLSMSGGFINAGGFLATGRFVSHVTGFATLFGVDIANSEIETALGILSVPIFFLLGSFIAGLLIDRPLYNNKPPHLDWVMGLCAIALATSALGSEILQLGVFGRVLKLESNYTLLVLLCLASGLQNGAITSSSGRSIRTTHLTGLTTDLGLGLARVVAFDLKRTDQHDEMRVNALRFGAIVSFIIGSALGAIFFLRLGYKGFFVPAAICAYAAWHGRKANTKLKKESS